MYSAYFIFHIINKMIYVRVAKRPLFGGMRSVIRRSEMMHRRCEESLCASVFTMASLSGLK